MALFDKNTWYLLKHLHHSLAVQAAACVEAEELVTPMAYLVTPSPAQDGPAGVDVAELSAEFMARLMHQPQGTHLLAKYLADALREGSLVQQQIAHEYGVQPTYTVSVQETVLPHADNQSSPRPALMVLLCGSNFTLPIFHLIEVRSKGLRRCQLRAFPEMPEIEAVQHLLQVRSQHTNLLH